MKTKYIGLIFIIFLSFLAGCHTLKGEFVSDDFVLIDAAENVGVIRMFTSNWLGERGEGGFYRPIVLASWKFDRLLYGVNPRGYHFTNIVLHVAITIMAYLLIWYFSAHLWTALPAAALFAVHPVHVEAIAWISGRTDTVAAFFYLLSILCFLKASEKESLHHKKLTYIALASGICAMLSKEIAYTLPFVITALDILNRKERRVESLKLGYTPYYIALAAVILLRYLTLGSVVGGYGSDTHLRVSVMFRYMTTYLQFFIEPFGMPGRPYSLIRWIILAGFILLSMMVFLSKTSRPGIIWFWLTIPPVLTTCRAQYVYLPSIGLFWVLAVIFFGEDTSEQTGIVHLIRAAIWSLLVMICLLHTFELNRLWSHTGWVGKGVKNVFRSVYPEVDPSQRFVLINPPVNQRLNIGVFQNGLQQAVRMWYDDTSLEAVRFATPEQYADRQPDRDIVFQFVNDNIVDMSAYYRGREPIRYLWPESPHETVLANNQTIDLSGLEQPVTGVEILSQLSHSDELTDNTPVAEIIVTFRDGRTETHYFEVGTHTSEWAYDRKDVRERVRHDRAPIAYSYIGSDFPAAPFSGHTYRGLIAFDQTGTPANISVRSMTHTLPIPQSGNPVILTVRMISAVNQAD
jgi:hypothetical protein